MKKRTDKKGKSPPAGEMGQVTTNQIREVKNMLKNLKKIALAVAAAGLLAGLGFSSQSLASDAQTITPVATGAKWQSNDLSTVVTSGTNIQFGNNTWLFSNEETIGGKTWMLVDKDKQLNGKATTSTYWSGTSTGIGAGSSIWGYNLTGDCVTLNGTNFVWNGNGASIDAVDDVFTTAEKAHVQPVSLSISDTSGTASKTKNDAGQNIYTVSTTEASGLMGTIGGTVYTRNGSTQQSATTGSGNYKWMPGTKLTSSGSSAATTTESFIKNAVTITYSANGGTGTIANGLALYGQDFTLPTSGMTRTDYTLIGWAETAGATTATWTSSIPAATVNGWITSSTTSKTLYAVWQSNKVVLTLGNEYTLGGFKWIAAETPDSGDTYVLQMSGVVSGTKQAHGYWPGYVNQNISGSYYTGEYSYINIATSALQAKYTGSSGNFIGDISDLVTLYNSISSAESTGAYSTGGAWSASSNTKNGLYLVPQTKTNNTGNGTTGSGHYYTALVAAATARSSFGASSHHAWLGSHGTNTDGAWNVYSGGFVCINNYQNYDFVLAPAFNLDASKVTLSGTTLTVK